jgi:hypothetical protein
MFKKSNIVWRLAMLVTILLAAGCNTAAPATPTQNPSVIYTQAAITVQAQLTNSAKLTPQPTATFTLAPTATATVQKPTSTGQVVPTTGAGTPVITPLATAVIQPTSSGGFGSGPDKGTFISQTVADNSTFGPGQTFTITWNIKNAGTTTWTTKYKVRYFGGETYGAPKEAFLSPATAVGGTLKVKMDMKAPSKAGSYNSVWVLTNEEGTNYFIFNLAIIVK